MKTKQVRKKFCEKAKKMAQGENDRPAEGAVPEAPEAPAVAIRSDEFPLHECVFRGDVKELSLLIRKNETDLGLRDPHGNTALHLATMLGRRECVHLLCAHGAPVKIKNKLGWSPLAEAVR